MPQRERVCSPASVEKMFSVSSACTAFSVKGNVIQAAEGEASRGQILYAEDERVMHSHNVHLYLRFNI